MLLHLPIAIVAALSPVADVVPKFDIAKECHFEGGSTAIFDRCSHDEADALKQLQAEWPQFTGADRSACLPEAKAAGFTSYVELLICLEMARDVRNEQTNPRGAQSTRPTQPEMSVVDKRD